MTQRAVWRLRLTQPQPQPVFDSEIALYLGALCIPTRGREARPPDPHFHTPGICQRNRNILPKKSGPHDVQTL